MILGVLGFGAIAAAKAAFATLAPLPDAAPPAHPVLFYNPNLDDVHFVPS